MEAIQGMLRRPNGDNALRPHIVVSKNSSDYPFPFLRHRGKTGFDQTVQRKTKEKFMTSRNDSATYNSLRRHRGWWGLGAVVLVAAVAFAQLAPLQIIPLALGTSSDKNVILHIKGPSDVLQTDLIFQPGGTTGWHYHPGPVVVVIKTGALTEIQSDGCTVVHPAGSAFFEDANVVHNVVNQTGVVTEVYATFLSPAGSQPLIPAADPGGVCRN
jgi:quercetin dioxygenase-like cupin family protein